MTVISKIYSTMVTTLKKIYILQDGTFKGLELQHLSGDHQHVEPDQ